MNSSKIKEQGGKAIFAGTAGICILAVIAIFVFIILQSIPALSKIGFTDFLFGTKWNPDANDIYANDLVGKYGILNMIVGTVFSTIGALAVGGTLGYFTAVYLAFFCKGKLKKIINTMVNLLAGIPSVIYGFFAIKAVMKLFNWMSPTGNATGLFMTSLILGIMILPTVTSLTKTSLEAVPKSYYEGSLALGATKERAIFRTMFPAASSGVMTAIILGVGRAIGETAAITLLCGNIAQFPTSLTDPFVTLASAISSGMGYSSGLRLEALVGCAAVLFVFVLIITVLIMLLKKKAR